MYLVLPIHTVVTGVIDSFMYPHITSVFAPFKILQVDIKHRLNTTKQSYSTGKVKQF